MAGARLHTRLCDELGIKYPIIQAGMGGQGNATPPELVAAVSEAGGLGCIGGSGLQPEEIRRRIRAVKQMTDKPFGVNLLLPAKLDKSVTADRDEMRVRLEEEYPKHVAFVQDLHRVFGLEPKRRTGFAFSFEMMQANVDVVIEEKVPVFAAGLGDPAWVVPRAHAIGTKVMGLAGSRRAAERQAAAGVDYVIAQGFEAGGHTGKIANFPLLPSVVDSVAPIPVIASGGIASGRGIVAALALGAIGVWVGTAFLVSEETNIYDIHQKEILGGRHEDFITTRAYSGKTARDYKNPVIDAWDASGLEFLPMPWQGLLMADFTLAAEEAGRHELINNPAGQVAGSLTQKRPAKEILLSMVNEAEEVLERLGKLSA